jgi:DnaK suppressor protein
MTEADARRSELDERRGELLGRVTDLRSDLARLIEATVDANLDDEHDPEGATVAFERSQLSAVLEAATGELAELDAAAERLRRGRYGRCVTCGRPVGAERLAARPSAQQCIECATRRR